MNGPCLCGAVQITAPAVKEIGACHCGFCRRWGGGPLLALHCGADVTFSGSEPIGIYASSEWAERAFCKQCGTHLYYRLLSSGEYFVPAGVFDATDFKMASQIYIDSKPVYYDFANQTPMLTELEVLQQFGFAGANDAGTAGQS